MAPLKNTIYLGPFVHSKTLKELEICENGAIGVDETGVIRFVERGVESVEEVVKKFESWNDAKVVRVKGEGFFFPGFVGRCFICYSFASRELHFRIF